MESLLLGCLFTGLIIHIHSYNFGFNNSYTCHCKDNIRCDSVTGSCNNGCLRGWGGVSCQQENVALDSTHVSQSGTHKDNTAKYGPQLVVDGYTSIDRSIHNCSDTETDRSLWQWWFIDLQQQYSIGYIKIISRYERSKHLTGFYVHIDDKLCYQDNRTDKPPVINTISCSESITGRNVNISHYRPDNGTSHYFMICEVEIYDCSRGTYGSDCNNFCHCSNYDQCDVITGQCPNGCQIGWHGVSCNTSCSTINKYGPGCQKRCDERQCSGDLTCDHVTGECINGCKPGYQGIDCSQDCPTGTYGSSCSKQCNNRQCKGSQECHHITGKCNGGCKPGYREDDCTVECSNGFYGAGCQKNCNNRKCLKTSTCDHVTGECIGGCPVGYKPAVLDCTQECTTDSYGEGCSKRCTDRNCKDSSLQCDSKTGECIDGCLPGFQFIDCTSECDAGFYGYNCSSNCSRFCQSEDECNNIDGACDCQDGYQGTDCTVIKDAVVNDDNDMNTSSETPVIAATVSVCVIIVIIVVIVVFIVWRKRRNGHSNESGKMDSINVDVVKPKVRLEHDLGPIYENSDAIREANEERITTEQSTEAQSESNLLRSEPSANVEYSNALPAETDLNLTELEEFVNNTNLRKGFEDLFKAMFDDFTSSYDISHIQENRKKNRFKGYYPYDETRVILEKLPGDPHSDYINANYMNGYDGKKIIGAQGATAVTIDDFVRMIWDIKCEKVVMVTREFEGGKTKCLRYWPEQGTEVFGEIKLTLKMEKIRANYTKRFISMERDGSTHEFCHFHYISWPDHGVPDIHDMLDFQYTVNKFNPNSTKPVLVHCSAGVGRTGTYIAIDYCLKRYNDIGKVDVLECVKRLREQRKGMVQTASQLQFIYQAVIEGIKRGDTAMKKDKFDSEYDEHNDSFRMGISTLKEQFTHLKSVKHNEEATEKNKLTISDKAHLYRHSLYTCGNSILFEDLNKVLIHNIWMAIYEAHIPDVVFILDSTNKVVVCPDVGSEETYGGVVVTTKSETNIKDGLNTLCVSISTTEGQPEQQVNVILMNFDKGYAKAPKTLYKCIIDIIVHLNTSQNYFGPLALFSNDTYYVRVFCILLNILQRISVDDEVEIFKVARKIHSQFGLTIKSQEEYNTLHNVVSDFVKSQSTYANL